MIHELPCHGNQQLCFLAQPCVVAESMLEGMDEFEEALSQQHGQMSPQEILQRFKKLFGREMNIAERRTFFLDTLPPDEEKG